MGVEPIDFHKLKTTSPPQLSLKHKTLRKNNDRKDSDLAWSRIRGPTRDPLGINRGQYGTSGILLQPSPRRPRSGRFLLFLSLCDYEIRIQRPQKTPHANGE